MCLTTLQDQNCWASLESYEKKSFGFDQHKFYNSETVLCIFKSAMIWAWCSITTRDSWMIWGEDQVNLTQFAGAHLTAQGWRTELVAKYLKPCSGHYSSQPQWANLGHLIGKRNYSEHHRFELGGEAVQAEREIGVEKGKQAVVTAAVPILMVDQQYNGGSSLSTSDCRQLAVLQTQLS